MKSYGVRASQEDCYTDPEERSAREDGHASQGQALIWINPALCRDEAKGMRVPASPLFRTSARGSPWSSWSPTSSLIWPPPDDTHTCCRSTADLPVSLLFLVRARGCSMRLGRDAYRWPPCKLTAGAAARSMGLRLRSRGSLRQSPLTVLFLEDRAVLREG